MRDADPGVAGELARRATLGCRTYGSVVEDGPIKLEYARPPTMETPPWRPAWLTILRAAGVAASGVAGGAVGYGAGIAAALSLVAIARTINPDWTPWGTLTLGLAAIGIVLAGILFGAIIGVRLALRLCRKSPQWR